MLVSTRLKGSLQIPLDSFTLSYAWAVSALGPCQAGLPIKGNLEVLSSNNSVLSPDRWPVAVWGARIRPYETLLGVRLPPMPPDACEGLWTCVW